jgi:hypothetical protein
MGVEQDGSYRGRQGCYHVLLKLRRGVKGPACGFEKSILDDSAVVQGQDAKYSLPIGALL